MNPELLKQKLAASGVQATLQGEPVVLRKIGAKDGLEARKLILGMQTNDLGQPVDLVDMATFYAFALSKSLTMPNGDLLFDSTDGRKALECVPLEELVPLAERAMQISGMAADPNDLAKKNLTPTTCTPPDSAVPSECPTLTNCSSK